MMLEVGYSDVLHTGAFVKVDVLDLGSFAPSAGSLMGNLMRLQPLDITLDIKAVYSVLMSLSSKEMSWANPRRGRVEIHPGIHLAPAQFPTM